MCDLGLHGGGGEVIHKCNLHEPSLKSFRQRLSVGLLRYAEGSAMDDFLAHAFSSPLEQTLTCTDLTERAGTETATAVDGCRTSEKQKLHTERHDVNRDVAWLRMEARQLKEKISTLEEDFLEVRKTNLGLKRELLTAIHRH
uniref:Uncharacterized protein n=1 Tax=Noctiluca scintillans TaxID=2966 RepID=A0A7S1F895_NOCSC